MLLHLRLHVEFYFSLLLNLNAQESLLLVTLQAISPTPACSMS